MKFCNKSQQAAVMAKYAVAAKVNNRVLIWDFPNKKSQSEFISGIRKIEKKNGMPIEYIKQIHPTGRKVLVKMKGYQK